MSRPKFLKDAALSLMSGGFPVIILYAPQWHDTEKLEARFDTRLDRLEDRLDARLNRFDARLNNL